MDDNLKTIRQREIEQPVKASKNTGDNNDISPLFGDEKQWALLATGTKVESEERFRQLVEKAGIAILIDDVDGNFNYFNKSFLELFGFSREEMKTQSIQTLVHPDDVDRVTSYHVDRLNGCEAPSIYEFKGIRKDGSVVCLEINAEALEEDGYCIGTRSYVWDITERVRKEDGLRQREAWFRQFFENAPEFCYMISPEGLILDVNPAALSFLGFKKDELVSKRLANIYAPESILDAERLLEKWRVQGELKNEEIYVKSKSGEIRLVLLSAGAVRDQNGHLLHSLSVQRDITDRVHAENDARDLAILADRQSLSSELHDSVTQMLYSTCLLADVLPQVWEQDQNEGRRNLEKIGRLTRRALAEMRTLLLEIQTDAFSEKSICDLIQNLCIKFRSRYRIPVHFKQSGECQKRLPSVQIGLYRIVQEALNNIVKHAGANQVSILMLCSPAKISISVSDDGCGFDPSAISSQRLGVRIMRDRAKKIGASLLIDSVPGEGTQIRVVWEEAGND